MATLCFLVIWLNGRVDIIIIQCKMNINALKCLTMYFMNSNSISVVKIVTGQSIKVRVKIKAGKLSPFRKEIYFTCLLEIFTVFQQETFPA